MLSNFKKFAALVLIGYFVFLAAAALWPFGAMAQGGVSPQPVVTVADAYAAQQKAITAAKQAILNSKEYAITLAITTALDTAAQRLAANAATFIVSGGKGKSALAYITDWNSWHDNILMDSVSDTLNTLSQKYLGFGICTPLNTQLDLRIKLGIARLYAPKPNCTFNQAYNAAIQDKNNISSGKFLSAIKLNFEMGSSPLSIAINTQYAVVNKSLAAAALAVNARLTSPYKPLTDAISGNVKTPANIIEQTSLEPIKTIKEADSAKKNITINKMDTLVAVGANALKVFTSTLMSKAIDKYLKGGTLSGKDILCASSVGKSFDLCHGAVNSNVAGTPNGTTDTALASAYFASLFTPKVNTIDDYNPLTDLSACPSDQTARGVWNCSIDQGFESALQAGDNGYLSVAEAVAAGSLHGDWELIPPNDPRNGAPDCYNSNYCYTNLVKLRRMRIIPVGWEMAALEAANIPNGVTLKTAMLAFNDCNANGQLDQNFPFCHLVDPDWILKAPVTQCRAQAIGQTLAAPNTSDRADVCVDAPSCVSEDGSGNCTGGFGYCTREHNVWQIDATACPSHYASCDSFTDPNGKDLSVLKNTVDASSCTAENAGCRPYAVVPGVKGWADNQPSIYLTSQAPECDASGAGCRALEDLKTAATANLVPNPSLETPTADGAMAEGWGANGSGAGTYSRVGFSSYDGAAAYDAGGNQLAPASPITVSPNALYTLSFYEKGESGRNATASIVSANGFTNHAYEPTCLSTLPASSPATPACSTTLGAAMNGTGEYITGNYKTTAGAFERFSLTFSTGSDTTAINIVLSGGTIDAIQLESGATATTFHAGGSDSPGATVNIKAPPAYLGCTGELDADAGKGCSAYAPVCRQSEVGCDEFTPSANIGTPVTAVTSGNDVCKAECVGYSTFKQEPTLWASAQFPLYFIPSTAKSCSMSEVGCDEFTNLQAAASGGESKSYFTYIRACRAPDAASDGNYFTWEGSDTSGYQLISYVLVNKVSGDGTMEAVPPSQIDTNGVTYVPKDPSAPAVPGPVYLTGTDLSACTQDIYTGANGAVKNPDCREFIDANGDIFYRLLSATITATADCQSYRKTLSTQTDCQASGGVWNNGACDYYTYAAQSKSCSAEVNGCRAYTGNRGNNVQSVFVSGFENNNLDAWSGGAVSSESTDVGGHSYQASPAVIRPLAYSNNSPLLEQGRSYTLTVWAKGTGNLSALFVGKNINSTDGSQYFADPTKNPIALTAEWQRYELGPVIMNWTPDGGDTLRLGVDKGKGYFDNIELDATQDEFALVSGSWKTPASCDETSSGVSLPQAQLGCSEYANKAGTTVDLKSFDHLCREQAVGCSAFTDTQGTDTPFASIHNVVCHINGSPDPTNARDCMWFGKTVCSVSPSSEDCRFDFVGSEAQLGTSGIYQTYLGDDTLVIPPDTTEFLVNDGTRSCDASEVGCTALGDNNLNTLATCSLGSKAAKLTECMDSGFRCNVYPGQSSCSYRVPQKVNGSTVYKTIDPANLSQQLCTQDAVSCQAWTTTSGDKTYFKDPGAALCEYKDNATLNNNSVSGWFKKGTSEPCDPTFVVNGNALGIRKNLDSEFDPNDLGGVCPSQQAACTEFTDHADTGAVMNGKPEFPSGRPFYYINDSKITDATAACNGQVSQKQGCLVLDQTDNPQKVYDTAATYQSSNSQGFKMVAPIDGATLNPVQTNDANIIMKVTRDRVCSEWLECNTDETVTDPATGRDTTRCLGLGSCLEKGPDGRCSKWGQLNPNATALTSALYAGRDVTSSGSDFSGFSIPNQPPVAQYKQTNAAPYKLTTAGGTPSAIIQSCKEYPETDSPFPKTVLANPTGPVSGSRKVGLNNTNVCEYQANDLKADKQPINQDCECSYRKASYGDTITKYFPPNAEAGTRADGTAGEIKSAVCSGGPYDGKECWPLATGNRVEPNNLSCENGNNSGECAPLTKTDSLIGEEGYCLEHDNTLAVNGSSDTACITWLPIDSAQGRDTANQFTSAAFIPKVGQERYCAAPAKYCVPHDCANPPEVPAVCTELRNATGVAYGCFTAGAPAATCVPIIKKYCDAMAAQNCENKTGDDPSCQGFVKDATGNSSYCQDVYSQCNSHQAVGWDFCTKMGYPNPGIDPLSSVDSFCGFDPSTVVDPTTGKSPADSWSNGLNGCATSGTQFCGNGEACADGTECAAMNDLSVHQTEYTQQEGTENYCANPITLGVETLTRCPQSPVSYKTIPNVPDPRPDNNYGIGAHSFFGASDADSNGKYIPLLSSNSLKFTLAEQSGDWINIYNTDSNGKNNPIIGNSLNDSIETKRNSPIIGSYPLDLVGLYYFGNPSDVGTASVSYDLAAPSLLLASQIDRVTIKVLSDAKNGLCQYGDDTSRGGQYDYAKTGECADSGGGKGIFSGNGYGYDPINVGSTDDETFTNDRRPSFVTLTDANNWSGQLSGSEGTATFTLLLSNNDPKRVTGIKLDLFDYSKRGYIYVAGLDVHLRGPVCGAATYVGSSNPTAEQALWPIVYTNSVNSVGIFNDTPITQARGGTFLYDAACTPFGAFSASNPQTYVTDSQAQTDKTVCELDKGGITAGTVEQQKIFAQPAQVRLFDEATDNFSGKVDSSLTPWKLTETAASFNLPQVASAICDSTGSCQPGASGSTMSINNTDTGALTAVGSFRANLKFYATANADQMPIRRVKILWGDGTDFVDPGLQNYYKNHDGGTNACSQTSSSSFANTSNACDTKPFAYSHVYSCDKNTLGIKPSDKAYPAIGVAIGQPICDYMPVVFVTDNWGATVMVQPSPTLPAQPVSQAAWSTVHVILAPTP